MQDLQPQGLHGNGILSITCSHMPATSAQAHAVMGEVNVVASGVKWRMNSSIYWTTEAVPAILANVW